MAKLVFLIVAAAVLAFSIVVSIEDARGQTWEDHPALASYAQIVSGMQTSQAGEVCLDDEDLLFYLQSPPYPALSAEVFLTLTGEQALMFLRLTGGSALATEERTLYFWRAPAEYFDRVAIAVADVDGCLVSMAGEKTQHLPGNLGYATGSDTAENIREALEAVGVPQLEVKAFLDI